MKARKSVNHLLKNKEKGLVTGLFLCFVYEVKFLNGQATGFVFTHIDI